VISTDHRALLSHAHEARREIAPRFSARLAFKDFDFPPIETSVPHPSRSSLLTQWSD
jgi:hypothetical protein